MNWEGTMEYLKANIFRILEIGFVIVGVFLTMQYNIKAQGTMISVIQEQQKQQTVVLQNLVVTVERLKTRQENISNEVDRLRDSR